MSHFAHLQPERPDAFDASALPPTTVLAARPLPEQLQQLEASPAGASSLPGARRGTGERRVTPGP